MRKTELSETQMKILRILIEGLSNIEIAEKMGLSVHTVKTHISVILRKMSVKTRVEAVTKAFRQKMVK